tara:strand:+ start:1227 stop:1754 length:528 start_codon:yes stop_codon:yes gene_type:complete
MSNQYNFHTKTIAKLGYSDSLREKYMKFYRDKSSLYLPFLRGSALTYVGVDNIITGPFRELMIEYFRLGDFGSNAREEYLYYLLLFFGLLQLFITLQSAFQPVIEIIDTKVILRTKEKTLSVIKNTFDIINLEVVESNYLQFSFRNGEVYNVQLDDVSIKEVQKQFTSFNLHEEE